MDLRQLRYLVVVHDEGGVRAAARRLHVSQPQIYRALRQLEREAGVDLLHRHHNGVELSVAGEELVARGREILERVSDAQAAMRRLGEQHATTLRVGVAVGVLGAAELLAPILDAYRGARPDVGLDVDDLGMQDQLTPLLQGDVDATIVRLPLKHPDIVVTPIAQEPRILLLNATHELAGEDSVAVEDVLHFPTLTIGSRPEWNDFWELNAERGRSHRASDVAPATTVGEAQASIACRPIIVSAAAATGRLTPNALVRTVRLTGVAPSVIGVARLRRDTRRIVRDFVTQAQATAESNIALLPDGVLPPG
jgi:DNA-binding transcriptional LysR family regulator